VKGFSRSHSETDECSKFHSKAGKFHSETEEYVKFHSQTQGGVLKFVATRGTLQARGIPCQPSSRIHSSLQNLPINLRTCPSLFYIFCYCLLCSHSLPDGTCDSTRTRKPIFLRPSGPTAAASVQAASTEAGMLQAALSPFAAPDISATQTLLLERSQQARAVTVLCVCSPF
jgi:hypothetical protein